jgi:glyoxylase-like metal-dependent hydrolase (beta-lactamase superfamily II)
MRLRAEGRIHEHITAIASVAYPGYIVQGDRTNLMIDAGLNLLGPRYLAALSELFGNAERLDYLLLSHSHYDHLGAACYLKRHLPSLQVGGDERLAGLLQKPSVLEMMNRLSGSHVDLLKSCSCDEDLSLQPFSIDMALKEGDELDVGGLTCRVYEVPGHTRDSLAFYFPEIGALFPGDACGVKEGEAANSLRVEFLASYQDYLDSLERMIALKPAVLCLGHGWTLTGEDAADFLERSLVETARHRELIERYLDAADGDAERATREFGRDEYDIKGGIRQKRPAYMTNLAAQFRHIAELRAESREFLGRPGSSEDA